jgi:hypothetical protein
MTTSALGLSYGRARRWGHNACAAGLARKLLGGRGRLEPQRLGELHEVSRRALSPELDLELPQVIAQALALVLALRETIAELHRVLVDPDLEERRAHGSPEDHRPKSK